MKLLFVVTNPSVIAFLFTLLSFGKTSSGNPSTFALTPNGVYTKEPQEGI
jgi:hypothetical protein